MSPLDLFLYIVFAFAAFAVGAVVAGLVYCVVVVVVRRILRWAGEPEGER